MIQSVLNKNRFSPDVVFLRTGFSEFVGNMPAFYMSNRMQLPGNNILRLVI